MSFKFNKKCISFALVLLLVFDLFPVSPLWIKVKAAGNMEVSSMALLSPDDSPIECDQLLIDENAQLTVLEGAVLNAGSIVVKTGGIIVNNGTINFSDSAIFEGSYSSEKGMLNGKYIEVSNEDSGKFEVGENAGVSVTESLSCLSGNIVIGGYVEGLIFVSKDNTYETYLDIDGSADKIKAEEGLVSIGSGHVNEIETSTFIYPGDYAVIGKITVDFPTDFSEVADDLRFYLPPNTVLENVGDIPAPVIIGYLDAFIPVGTTYYYNDNTVADLFKINVDLGELTIGDLASFTIKNAFPADITYAVNKDVIYPFVFDGALKDNYYFLSVGALSETRVTVSVANDYIVEGEITKTAEDNDIIIEYPVESAEGQYEMEPFRVYEDIYPKLNITASIKNKEMSQEEEIKEGSTNEKTDEKKEEVIEEKTEEKKEETTEEKKEEVKEEKKEEAKEEKKEEVKKNPEEKQTDDTDKKVLKKGDGRLKVNDCILGSYPKINVESPTNDATNAVIIISKGDKMYEKPVDTGTYTVTAILQANNEYSELRLTSDFSVKYLDTPKDPYTIKGTVGDNKYYLGEVTISPKTGYKIATDINGIYADNITLKESTGLGNVFLMNENGEKTGAVSIDNILIDTKNPVISGVGNEKEKYAETLNLNISDDNLSKIFVNDEEIKVGGTSMEIILETKLGYDTFTVKAIDKSGRETEIQLTLMAEWMKDKTVPEGTVKIIKGEKYKLGPGLSGVEGDNSRYADGTDFYVSDDAVLTFK